MPCLPSGEWTTGTCINTVQNVCHIYSHWNVLAIILIVMDSSTPWKGSATIFFCNKMLVKIISFKDPTVCSIHTCNLFISISIEHLSPTVQWFTTMPSTSNVKDVHDQLNSWLTEQGTRYLTTWQNWFGRQQLCTRKEAKTPCTHGTKPRTFSAQQLTASHTPTNLLVHGPHINHSPEVLVEGDDPLILASSTQPYSHTSLQQSVNIGQ